MIYYCIAAMLRNGISAHTQISTLAQCVSLRFIRERWLILFKQKWKTVDFDCFHPTVTEAIASSALSFESQVVGWLLLFSRLWQERTAISQHFDMLETLSSSAEDNLQSSQNTVKTLGRVSEKGDQQSRIFCFGTKCTSVTWCTKLKLTHWARVEFSAWALIPFLNIAAIQYRVPVCGTYQSRISHSGGTESVQYLSAAIDNETS